MPLKRWQRSTSVCNLVSVLPLLTRGTDREEVSLAGSASSKAIFCYMLSFGSQKKISKCPPSLKSYIYFSSFNSYSLNCVLWPQSYKSLRVWPCTFMYYSVYRNCVCMTIILTCSWQYSGYREEMGLVLCTPLVSKIRNVLLTHLKARPAVGTSKGFFPCHTQNGKYCTLEKHK